MIAHWFFDDSERDTRRAASASARRLSLAGRAAHDRLLCRLGAKSHATKPPGSSCLRCRPLRGVVRGNRRALSVVLASVAVSLVLLCALAIFTKPPPSRIYIPVLAFPLAFALVVSGARLTGPTSTTASSSSNSDRSIAGQPSLGNPPKVPGAGDDRAGDRRREHGPVAAMAAEQSHDRRASGAGAIHRRHCTAARPAVRRLGVVVSFRGHLAL